ncbi:hypothetical protein Cni_G22573 [Canna indica]|uniref:Uncharacterized protein n=1 Tax=Canna indica TaxID=4628 RepID=A0AAQ3KS24_9LILI|nr:hypothetical protein Cni_G22573 [Canna indica]
MGATMSSSKAFCCFLGTSSCRNDEEEPRSTRKICPSDEDGLWVGEHDIDQKASDFIARFHESVSTEPDHQAIMI